MPSIVAHFGIICLSLLPSRISELQLAARWQVHPAIDRPVGVLAWISDHGRGALVVYMESEFA